MRIALYARVSTTVEDADLQVVELRRNAAARDWVIAGEFVDRGVPGSATSRLELDQLWAAARRRDVDGVVVRRFDRFSRSVSDYDRADWMPDFRVRLRGPLLALWIWAESAGNHFLAGSLESQSTVRTPFWLPNGLGTRFCACS